MTAKHDGATIAAGYFLTKSIMESLQVAAVVNTHSAEAALRAMVKIRNGAASRMRVRRRRIRDPRTSDAHPRHLAAG